MSRKIPTICPYCGGRVIFTDSSAIYGGRSYGMIYLCTNCNASVGVHKGTRKPLGTLANTALKNKRRETHAVFDGYWKQNGIKRTDAYKWLARQMRLPEYRTHIGQMDMELCERVIQIVQAQIQKKKEAA
ncbi:zinc-finger-containing protein [Anaerotruncus rubiinfantis]|uniref:zinc-finger-containing protein n=1 Tax=Anaerotruncus rubiinfantis TaxID=1720200 RepID=UPI003D7A346C